MLTKESILELCKLNTQEMDIPEFGGVIRIRELTLEDVSRIYRETQECDEGERGYQDILRTVAAGMIDENDNPVFTVEQISGLSKRYSEVVVRIYRAIGELSNVNKVEELEKNSETAQTVNSSSS